MNTTFVGKQFERLVGKVYSEMGYDVELSKIIKGRSGADLKALVEDAKKGPLRDLHSNDDPVRKVVRSDFDTAFSERSPTVNSWYFEAIQGCRRFREDKILEDVLKHLPASLKKEQVLTVREVV